MKYFPKLIFDRYILFYTGKIYNLKSKKFMKLSRRSKLKEYLRVNLMVASKKQKSFNIHRLIALNFIENDDPVNKIEVDHKNINPTDNRICNLEWVTKRRNQLNKRKKGYSKFFCNTAKRFKVVWKISDIYLNYKASSKYFKTEAEADKFIEDNYPFPTTIE